MRNTFEYYNEDAYLEHHGIKGQKWGIRRYQNPDGSLTEEGKKRYLNSDGSLTKAGKKEYDKANKKIDRVINFIDYKQEALRNLMNSYWFEDDREREHNNKVFKDVYTGLMNDFKDLKGTETLISNLGQTPLRDISEKTDFYGRFYNDSRNPYRK